MSPKKIHKPIILVVDDTPENIDVLKGALIADYMVRPAPSGQIALKAAHVQPYPDLILLDIMMPGMDGYEVCRRLKADPAAKDIPIIFVTAKSEVEDELKGLQLGAVDYITKPFSVPIVQARVKTHLALRAANRLLDERNQVLQEERELIESIILKMRHADTFDERYVRHLISPVEVTAGDMLLSTFAPDGRQLVLLGDFTGHGLPAAIGGPLVTYVFHEQAKNGIAGEQILQEINAQLCARLPTGIFFCVTLLEISAERLHATLWNAGLPDTLLVRGGSIQGHFPSTMLPLGIAEGLNPTAICLLLEPGDRLYTFSDGIIETSTQGEMFGMERLEAFLTQVVTGRQTLDDLIPLLNEYAGSTMHDDDITLVEVRL